MRFLRITLAAACAAAVLTLLATANAGAATPPRASWPRVVPAEASFVQGLPNTAVDVYLNGTEVVQDLGFTGVVGPLPLLPGHYHIAVRVHGTPQSTPPLLKGNIWLRRGDNVTIVADLDSAGNPALTKFWNPVAALAKGRAELVVRNVAEDPGFNVYASGLRIFRDLTNPNGGRIRLPSEWIRLRMTDFGSKINVIGPFPLRLHSQTVTIVYAIGSPTTLTTVEQTYSTN